MGPANYHFQAPYASGWQTSWICQFASVCWVSPLIYLYSSMKIRHHLSHMGEMARFRGGSHASACWRVTKETSLILMIFCGQTTCDKSLAPQCSCGGYHSTNQKWKDKGFIIHQFLKWHPMKLESFKEMVIWRKRKIYMNVKINLKVIQKSMPKRQGVNMLVIHLYCLQKQKTKTQEQ